MWNWFRRKKTPERNKEIDAKLNALNDSVKECIVSLYSLESEVKNVHKKLDTLETKIKEIPKEMIIKNVLSI